MTALTPDLMPPDHRESTRFVLLWGLIYMVLNLWTACFHEPWFDEAQAWLIARDASIPEIFALMNYEGTPALWHLLLVPLAKTGIPYFSMALLHVLIATAAVAVFLRCAPFPQLVKLLFVFSYDMAYEYAIIARSYGLSFLLLFLTAAAYGKRFSHPLRYALLLFLLSNTNTFALFVACSLAAAFFWESVREHFSISKRAGILIVALLIMFSGIAAAGLQLIPEGNDQFGSAVNMVKPMEVPRAIRSLFFATSGDKRSYEAVALVIMVLALLTLMKKPMALAILAFPYLTLFYVFVFKYPWSERRHHAYLLFILIFALWISTYYQDRYWFGFKERVRALYERYDVTRMFLGMLSFCLLINVFFSLKVHCEDLRYPVSTSKDVAKYLVERGLDRHLLVEDPASGCAMSVLPHIPHARLWHAGEQEHGSYTIWTKVHNKNQTIAPEEIVGRARKTFHDFGGLLFLLSRPLQDPGQYGLSLLMQADDSRWITRDSCYLYGLIEGAPITGPRPAQVSQARNDQG